MDRPINRLEFSVIESPNPNPTPGKTKTEYNYQGNVNINAAWGADQFGLSAGPPSTIRDNLNFRGNPLGVQGRTGILTITKMMVAWK